MQDQANTITATKRVPWNKGKLTGASHRSDPNTSGPSGQNSKSKAAFRDLALFNLAMDHKRRGCDVVAIRVEDIAAGGYTTDRATVRQRKTGRPVRFG